MPNGMELDEADDAETLVSAGKCFVEIGSKRTYDEAGLMEGSDLSGMDRYRMKLSRSEYRPCGLRHFSSKVVKFCLIYICIYVILFTLSNTYRHRVNCSLVVSSTFSRPINFYSSMM